VYDTQIDPRKRYHKISRSLRAYSKRSRAADVGGFRRILREINSIARVTIRGRFECLSEVSNETRQTCKDKLWIMYEEGPHHKRAVLKCR
jgi:hypothetical protein